MIPIPWDYLLLLFVGFVGGFFWGLVIVPLILERLRRNKPLKSGRCPYCGGCIH